MNPDPTETEFIKKRKVDLNLILEALPQKFEEGVMQTKRGIEDLQRKSGIHGEVKRLEDTLETFRKELQSKSDNISGQLQLIELLEKAYHKTDYSSLIPEGVTHKYGIELAPYKYDLPTLLLILDGKRETVEALGGTLTSDTQELEDRPEDADQLEDMFAATEDTPTPEKRELNDEELDFLLQV